MVNQLRFVGIGKGVVGFLTLTSVGQETRLPQNSQVVGNRRAGHVDGSCNVCNAFLGVTKQPEYFQPCRIAYECEGV